MIYTLKSIDTQLNKPNLTKHLILSILISYSFFYIYTQSVIQNSKHICLTQLKFEQDARKAMRVVFAVLTKRISMHKKEFFMNIFKYCLKIYIKLHEFANCNSVNYDV